MFLGDEFLQSIDPAEDPHKDDHQSRSGKDGGDHEIGAEDGTVPSWLQGDAEDPCQDRVDDDGDGNDHGRHDGSGTVDDLFLPGRSRVTEGKEFIDFLPPPGKFDGLLVPENGKILNE